MTLSCGCHGFDTDGWDWWYYNPNDFTPYNGKRRTRCCSCQVLIAPGDECVCIDRVRAPRSEIEERIHGEEIPIASWYLCEKCGEIFLNLTAYGYCVEIQENMTDQLHEHWELTGFVPPVEAA